MAVAVTGIAAVMVMRHWRAGRLDRAEEAVQDRPERLSDMLVLIYSPKLGEGGGLRGSRVGVVGRVARMA